MNPDRAVRTGVPTQRTSCNERRRSGGRQSRRLLARVHFLAARPARRWRRIGPASGVRHPSALLDAGCPAATNAAAPDHDGAAAHDAAGATTTAPTLHEYGGRHRGRGDPVDAGAGAGAGNGLHRARRVPRALARAAPVHRPSQRRAGEAAGDWGPRCPVHPDGRHRPARLPAVAQRPPDRTGRRPPRHHGRLDRRAAGDRPVRGRRRRRRPAGDDLDPARHLPGRSAGGRPAGVPADPAGGDQRPGRHRRPGRAPRFGPPDPVLDPGRRVADQPRHPPQRRSRGQRGRRLGRHRGRPRRLHHPGHRRGVNTGPDLLVRRNPLPGPGRAGLGRHSGAHAARPGAGPGRQDDVVVGVAEGAAGDPNAIAARNAKALDAARGPVR